MNRSGEPVKELLKLDEKGYTRKVINSGRDSGTVGHFLDNYEWEIGRFKPNLVIMSFGFNHLETENAGSLDIEAKKLIEKIQADGSEMVIWSTYATIKPDLTTKLEAVSRRWRLIAERNNCLFVDIFDEFRKLDLTDFFTYHYQWKNEVWNLEPGDIDFLHTNVRGNKLIAKVLLEKIFDLPILEWEDVGTMN